MYGGFALLAHSLLLWLILLICHHGQDNGVFRYSDDPLFFILFYFQLRNKALDFQLRFHADVCPIVVLGGTLLHYLKQKYTCHLNKLPQK